MGGCNCRGSKGRRTAPTPRRAPRATAEAPKRFKVITASGTTERYGSRLEAEAANARAGGTGRVERIV